MTSVAGDQSLQETVGLQDVTSVAVDQSLQQTVGLQDVTSVAVDQSLQMQEHTFQERINTLKLEYDELRKQEVKLCQQKEDMKSQANTCCEKLASINRQIISIIDAQRTLRKRHHDFVETATSTYNDIKKKRCDVQVSKVGAEDASNLHKRRLSELYQTQKNREYAADELQMSYRKISKIFKETSKHTANNEKQMLIAKQAIIQTLSVTTNQLHKSAKHIECYTDASKFQSDIEMRLRNEMQSYQAKHNIVLKVDKEMEIMNKKLSVSLQIKEQKMMEAEQMENASNTLLQHAKDTNCQIEFAARTFSSQHATQTKLESMAEQKRQECMQFDTMLETIAAQLDENAIAQSNLQRQCRIVESDLMTVKTQIILQTFHVSSLQYERIKEMNETSGCT